MNNFVPPISAVVPLELQDVSPTIPVKLEVAKMVTVSSRPLVSVTMGTLAPTMSVTSETPLELTHALTHSMILPV